MKVLFEYQQLEVAERKLCDERSNAPEMVELKSIRSEFAANKQQYLSLINEIAALENLVASFPAQIAMQQEKIDAEQSAAYDGSVSDMKMLTARENQLSALQERLAQLEGEKLAREDELVGKQAEVSELKQIMDAQYERFRALKAEYEDADVRREQQISNLSAAKAELAKRIPEKDMTWFNNSKSRFRGSPLAMLDSNQVCCGCHTMVTPICYKRVTQGIVSTCENCGRTLFVADAEL